MTFKQAIQVLKNRVHLNLTDEQAELYGEAATVIQSTAKLPVESYDWILEGDYDGDETARSIRKEWKE
jgi:hypothetical protein